MSTELIKARANLAQLRGLLKQGKLIPACLGLHDALLTVLKNPLMKAEREEFTLLFEDAVFAMGTHPTLRAHFPREINYEPGREKEIVAILRSVLTDLENSQTKEAKQRQKEMEHQREDLMGQANAYMAEHEYEQAKRIFDLILKEDPDNTDLKTEFGERFLAAARYEEAFEYLSMALEDNPESILLYNRIGMALRKMGRFDTAEKYYQKALEINPEDPNLHFNVGRLYIDWRKWPMVKAAAEMALKYQPDFAEAAKMRNFAVKKMNGK